MSKQKNNIRAALRPYSMLGSTVQRYGKNLNRTNKMAKNPA